MFVSAAAATVTIGPTDLSGNQGSAGGTDATFVQVTQPTAGVFLTVPADGVLTAWHVHGQALNGGTLALRVLRDHADGTFTSVATSDPVEANLSDGSPAHAVSIPVLAGDYIGVAAASPTAASSPSVFVTKPSGATYDALGPGFAVGSTMSPASASSGRLMLNAVESVRPAVSGVAPSSGPTSGGQAVTITGSNLDGATEVTFGGTPAAGFTASANQITAVAPAHTQGTIDVQVTGPGGVSPATSADAYTFVEPGGTPPSTTPTAANGPIISGVGQTARRWRENNTLAHLSATRKPPLGTTFSFDLNEPATVTLRFTKRAAGRKAHGRCVAPSAKNRRKPRCTRTTKAGALTLTGHAGHDKVRFAGRISRTRKLKPGRYTVRITATDAQGRRSARRSLTFTIVK